MYPIAGTAGQPHGKPTNSIERLEKKPDTDMEPKNEIVQIVNKLPDEVLGDLLQYLRQVEKTSLEKMRLSLNLNTILTEDRELLEKLAK
jgi:restriction endonuclease Mrr